MRAFIKNYIEAEKARREEEGREAGFSLIELIVVVVILGILAAIAIPVFIGLQGTAQDNAAKAVAANGATQATAEIASGNPATLIKGTAPITVAFKGGTTPTTVGGVCVEATSQTGTVFSSGPGC